MPKIALFALALIWAVIIVITPVNSVQSQTISQASQPITQESITLKYQIMRESLNDRSNRQAAIAFLDSHVSTKGRFIFHTHNTIAPTSEQKQKFVLDKTRYIQSFIDGTNFIDNYSITIDVHEVSIEEDGLQATSQETITERGIALNPFNMLEDGKAFIAITTCTTRHVLQDDKAVSDTADCRTTTSLEHLI